MRKESTFQYSDVLRTSPYGKTSPGTVTSALSKGQRSNPTKFMDVPLETRKMLRRKNGRELARDMERAGGATTPQGRAYAAVLEERGVNPNLARQDMNMARTTPNDMFKRAMYDAFADEMLKIAEGEAAKNSVEYDPRFEGLKTYGMSAAPSAGVGAAAGGLGGMALGSVGGLKGALFTGALGAGVGGAATYKSMKQQPNAPGFDRAVKLSRGED